MKKLYVFICAALLVAACGHKMSREEMIKNIEVRESGLDYSTTDPDVIDSVQAAMVDLYRQFYVAFPDDSLAPVYMQRSADMLVSLQRTDEAVAVLDSIIDQYPGFEDIGGCWFLKGYAYEMVEEFDSARAIYSYFVDNYPDHVQARDTRTRLVNNYIGMSDEEMFEAIMRAASDKGLTIDD